MENHFLLKILLREMSSAHPRPGNRLVELIIRIVQTLPEAWIGGSWKNTTALATNLWLCGARKLEREGEMRWQILGTRLLRIWLQACLATVFW